MMKSDRIAKAASAAMMMIGALLYGGCERTEPRVKVGDQHSTSGEFYFGTIEDFVSNLGNDHLKNYVLMTASESAQSGTPSEPRILFQGTDSTDVYCVSTKTNAGNLTERFIENIRWDDTAKKFDFGEFDEIVDPTFGPIVFRDDSEAKRDTCRACHGDQLRPNWDAYDSWGNMLPFHRDRLYADVPNGAAIKSHSQELLAYRRIMAGMATNPVGRYLQLPDGVTRAAAAPHAVTVAFPACGAANCDGNIAAFNIPAVAATALNLAGVPAAMAVDQGGAFMLMTHPNKPSTNPPNATQEGQGIRMFDQFSKFNGRKILQEHKDHADYADFKFVALGILKDCIPATPTKAQLREWAEDAHLEYIAGQLNQVPTTDFDVAYTTLKTSTLAIRKTLPLKKIKNAAQVDNMTALILANADWLAATGENGGKTRYDGVDYTKAQLQAGGNAVLNKIVAQELFRRKLDGFRYDEKELIVDREQYSETGVDKYITQWRYFLQAGHGVKVGNWSLSVMSRSGTYTFADVFGDQYKDQIKTGLEADPALTGLSCADLATASKARLDGGCGGAGCGGGSGSDAGVDAGGGSDSGGGLDAGIDASSGSDAGIDASSDAGSDADSSIDAGIDAGTGSGSDAGTGSGSDAGTGTGSDAGGSSGGLVCRDGTLSPTCTCGGPHTGCCSHHGGVAGCQ